MSVMVCDYLTDAEKEQIEKLHKLCSLHIPEGGTSSLSLLLTESDEDGYDDTFFILHLSDETKEILSFASVFCPDGLTAEISGFTHPEYRHRGYFSELLNAAEEESAERFGDVDFIYQCLSDDPDTVSFLKTQKMKLQKKECLMYLPDGPGIPKPADPSVVIEGPLPNSLLLKGIVIPIFPEMNMTAYDYLKTIQEDPASESYQINLKDGTPVGLFHLTKAQNICYLMGFGILPSRRGNHYALQALELMIHDLTDNKPLYLQVDDQNLPAYALYRKTGFITKVSVDYYTRL